MPFPTGDIGKERLHKLLVLAFRLDFPLSRGLHTCPFCPPVFSSEEWIQNLRVEYQGDFRYLGNGQIRIEAPGDKIFVAPDLIYHYASVHRFLSPKSFLEALDRLDITLPSLEP